jgi:hypothetical protein
VKKKTSFVVWFRLKYREIKALCFLVAQERAELERNEDISSTGLLSYSPLERPAKMHERQGVDVDDAPASNQVTRFRGRLETVTDAPLWLFPSQGVVEIPYW